MLGFTTEKKQIFQPTFGNGFQRGLDSVIGTFAPGWQKQRMQARLDVARFQYAAAHSGRDRRPPQPLQSPNSVMHQLDALTMMRRSQDLDRDDSFIGHLAAMYRMYALGTFQYIPNTGSRRDNDKYRDFFDEWMTKADAVGRFHFIDMAQLSLVGTIFNGDHGLVHHHNEDGTFQLQSVPGYNIGNPRLSTADPHCIRGIVIDDVGRPIAYRLYSLDINGMSKFVAEIPAAIFSHINPVKSTDQYRSVTPLHAVLNDAHDIRKVEEWWMGKIKWSGSKVAIVNTSNGQGPPPDPNTHDFLGADPLSQSVASRLVSVIPGEVIHGDPGMSIEMVDNQTPNPNETEFVRMKMAQIANSLHLPFPFVCVLMGLPGTYTRLISEQAKRTFQQGPLGQGWMRRTFLDEIKNKALMSGIIRGEIPYTERWNKGGFLFPAHPTVDVGRESDANLNENRQGIRSMSDITGEDGRYWADVDDQLSEEANNKIRIAIERAEEITKDTGVPVTWQEVMVHLQMMTPNGSGSTPVAPQDNSEQTQK